jgi:hypothetical protein
MKRNKPIHVHIGDKRFVFSDKLKDTVYSLYPDGDVDLVLTDKDEIIIDELKLRDLFNKPTK